MPELLEVETYQALAESTAGRTIEAVPLVDPLLVRGAGPVEVIGALVGATVVGVRRIGKLLLVDLDRGVLGLHFGMTGLLEVDGHFPIERLEYASARREPRWVRFEVGFVGGGVLRVHDQRRFGAIELDPDETRLGPDASLIGAAALGRALGSSTAPLKARLLDQARVAGLGNLLVDEVLWRAGLDPARPAGGLSAAEVRRLHRHLRVTLDELRGRGGSHTGDLQASRARGGRCPRDGTELVRRVVGGRTTISCPRHQR